MDKPLQKAIAREGLVIICLYAGWIVFVIFSCFLTGVCFVSGSTFYFPKEMTEPFVLLTPLIFYGAILIIRFAVWAVRTLMSK